MRNTLRKIFIGSLIAFSLFGSTLKADQPVDFDINSIKFPPLHDVVVPEVKKVTLNNGLRLYLLEDHSLPLLDVSVRINIGSYLEPKNQIGLADIVGDLLREGGTEKWSPDELDELLEGLGASVETYGDVTFHHLSLNMLSEQKELAVELMNQILRHPRFDEARFNQSMISYKSGIARRNDNPSSVASREFRKMIYGKDSVFASQTEYSDLNNIKREDLINFHKRYYKPEFVMIAVCGDFKTDEMIALLKKNFDNWEKGNEKLPPIPTVNYDFDQRVGYI
jgi:zinc protease